MFYPICRSSSAPAGFLSSGLFSVYAQQTQGNGIPWWVWLLLVLVILVIAIWWYTARRPPEETYQAAGRMPSPEPAASPPAPDDLAVIEGIGPKIAALLQGAGITTFAELAETDPAPGGPKEGGRAGSPGRRRRLASAPVPAGKPEGRPASLIPPVAASAQP